MLYNSLYKPYKDKNIEILKNKVKLKEEQQRFIDDLIIPNIFFREKSHQWSSFFLRWSVANNEGVPLSIESLDRSKKHKFIIFYSEGKLKEIFKYLEVSQFIDELNKTISTKFKDFKKSSKY